MTPSTMRPRTDLLSQARTLPPPEELAPGRRSPKTLVPDDDEATLLARVDSPPASPQPGATANRAPEPAAWADLPAGRVVLPARPEPVLQAAPPAGALARLAANVRRWFEG